MRRASRWRRFTTGALTARPSHLPRREEVAGAADRPEPARVPRIGLELLPEPRDVGVDRAVEHLVRAPLREIEQLFARQDPPRTLGDDAQQNELGGRELERSARKRGAVVPWRELQLTYPDDLPRRTHRAATSAHQRAKPGEQLARRERLRQVVVGPRLEPEHAIGLLAERGEHDDGHRAPGAQLATDLEP